MVNEADLQIASEKIVTLHKESFEKLINLLLDDWLEGKKQDGENAESIEKNGVGHRNRTAMESPPTDFESQ